MHHQLLELEYLAVMEVDFGLPWQVERLAVDATDYSEVIGFLERSAVQYAVAEGEETFLRVSPQFPYALRRVGLGVQVFFDTVELVYLGSHT